MARLPKNPWPKSKKRKRYKPGKVPKPAKFRRRQKSWAQAWRETRFWVLLILLTTLIVIWRMPGLVPVPDMFTTTPQQISAQFTRCDQGYTRHCVIDGDTIAIGKERIRILGIDTPEVNAGCEAEARLAHVATNELTDWLNEGPFYMRGRVDEPTDRYGRQLRELYRGSGLSRNYAGKHLIEEGLARRYYGAGRESWCE